MILPDVNILVFAFRREAPRHDEYAAWMAGVVGGKDDLALTESALTGFVRIVTNPRIMSDPAPTSHALAFVDVLRNARRARWLTPTTAAWETFASYAHADVQVRGNLVPDAWLAAMARSNRSRLATADRGFARYEGLDWFDPLPTS